MTGRLVWRCTQCDYATSNGLAADGHEYTSGHVLAETQEDPDHPNG